MPPKRQRSTRSAARKATSNDTSQPEQASPEQNVETLDPVSHAPSSFATTDKVQPTAAEASTANSPPASSVDSSIAGTSTTFAKRGKKLLSQPKFTGRRSQSELQKIQQAEDGRRKAEVEGKAVQSPQDANIRAEVRGRGGSTINSRGRGRGGYMGDRAKVTGSVASGIFGTGQASDESKRRKRYGSGVPGAKNYRPQNVTVAEQDTIQTSGRSAARGQTAATAGKKVKEEDGGESSRPVGDNDGDVAMEGSNTIQMFEDGGSISSDDDEGDHSAQRVNVEDLGVIDLTQDDADYDPFAPVRIRRFAHKERALGINADGATNHDGAIAVDTNDTVIPSSPEKRKGKQRMKDVEITSETKPFHGTYSDSDSDDQLRRNIKQDPEGVTEPARVQHLSSPESKRKAKEKFKAHAVSNEPFPDGIGRDEVEELERHQRDLEVLRSELGTQQSSDGKDPRADKIYLFQFPPVLPDLAPVVIKPDPEAMQEDQPGPSADHEIKASQPKLPSGAVGKLKVHASGKVTLDWGGTSLCLGKGTEASFLQDILVATLPESKEETEERGMAASMGQVKGKFVVTPDWDEIL